MKKQKNRLDNLIRLMVGAWLGSELWYSYKLYRLQDEIMRVELAFKKYNAETRAKVRSDA